MTPIKISFRDACKFDSIGKSIIVYENEMSNCFPFNSGIDWIYAGQRYSLVELNRMLGTELQDTYTFIWMRIDA